MHCRCLRSGRHEPRPSRHVRWSAAFSWRAPATPGPLKDPVTSIRRSDGGLPCHGHPLDRSKSDQAPAGLLARGSQLDARLPRLGACALPSGCSWIQEHVHRAIRLQLQGQPRIWEHAPAPHSRLSPLRGAPARSMKAGMIRFSIPRLTEVIGKANNAWSRD